jgi:Uncharacterized membrane protein (homolog of Drosophila rhomboid)
MIAGRHSEDYQPITWLGRVPVYATTLLVIAYVVAMTVGAVLEGSGMRDALGDFRFSTIGVLRNYQVWQIATYPFVNSPDIWFAIQMYLLFVFGRQVESFIGRRSFLWLYAALVLAPPVVLTLLDAVHLLPGPQMLVGSYELNFAIFIAFAVIYPSAQILFTLQAKWVAIVLLGIFSLRYYQAQMWVELGVLWLECACVVTMLGFSGVANASIERWLPERRERPVRVRRQREPVRKPKPKNEDLHESIDPLLEKISRHGIGSLTRAEREKLENARAALIEQEKQSH